MERLLEIEADIRREFNQMKQEVEELQDSCRKEKEKLLKRIDDLEELVQFQHIEYERKLREKSNG